jgi:hypothetical protein
VELPQPFVSVQNEVRAIHADEIEQKKAKEQFRPHRQCHPMDEPDLMFIQVYINAGSEEAY